MTIRPKLRMPLLAAALATTASAWAAYELGNSSYVPDLKSEAPPAQAIAEPTPAPTSAVSAEDAIDKNETVIANEEQRAVARRDRVVVPAEEARPAPAITITEPRLTVDQRIQAEVMDVLARNPNLSGKIGVVSQDAVVTLTGYTVTSGQAWRAGRDARGVYGVRHVVNEIRPRVGGITS